MIKALLLLAAALTAAAPAWGEKHVQSTLDSRLILAFKSNPAEVQRWLPAPGGRGRAMWRRTATCWSPGSFPSRAGKSAAYTRESKSR